MKRDVSISWKILFRNLSQGKKPTNAVGILDGLVHLFKLWLSSWKKKINMLKKITKRKLFLREFVRKSQWQGIYVGFEVKIVLTIFSLSFFFFNHLSTVNCCFIHKWTANATMDEFRAVENSKLLIVHECLTVVWLKLKKNNFSRTLLLSAENWAFWERSSIRVNSETSVLRFRINRKRSFYNEPPCLRKATLIPCS